MTATTANPTRALWKRCLVDIRFWVVLLLLLRLHGITNPPVEATSTVRQCDVLMVARNFYELDANLFYPRIDDRGTSELAGSEFPIFNYLIYLVSLPFGFSDWYGRLINLFISSLAAFCFYKVICRYLGPIAAFNSTFVLLFSAWLSYARVGIPDIFAASICIVSLYFALQYFEEGRISDVLIFTVLACIGCLSKISAASILTVLIIPMCSKDFLLLRKVAAICSATIILSVVCWWYYSWVPYLNSIGNSYFFMGMPFADGVQQFTDAPNLFLNKVYDDALKYIGGSIALASFVYAIRFKKFLLVVAFFVPLVAFSVFVLKSGRFFYINGYYFVMLVPCMAFIAGTGLSLLKSRALQLWILSAIAIENIASQYHNFKVGGPYAPYTQLEIIFDRIGSSQNDLIAVTGDTTIPNPLYFCHRKGWIVSNATLENAQSVEALNRKGCKYLLILKKTYNHDPTLSYDLVYDTADFKIYKL